MIVGVAIVVVVVVDARRVHDGCNQLEVTHERSYTALWRRVHKYSSIYGKQGVCMTR